MKKISFWLGILILTVSLARGQDTGTQQQLDKLSGQIQDILAAQEQQGKKLDALEKEISDLRDKVNTPAVSDGATREDLKALAETVAEIDQKRKDDRDMILKTLKTLATSGGEAAPVHPHKTTPVKTGDDGSAPAPAVPQNGYEYTVKPGDTLSIIAKSYRESEKHVKVTANQILAANPGLDANKLYVGKKIFIPDPAAK